MQGKEIFELLPKLYNIPDDEIKKAKKTNPNQKGLSKYQILNCIMMNRSRHDYCKLDECIAMGFLTQVNNNPPEFTVEKDKIFEFWKGSDIGKHTIGMLEDQGYSESMI